MVYCTECGTENEEGVQNCVNCGASLYPTRATRMRREKKDECFGLPHGSSIFGLVFGIIIILVGARELLGWKIDLGALAIIIFGVLIFGGAIYTLTQRKS